MGKLLEYLPSSYTITHMNTPDSFGEEIALVDNDDLDDESTSGPEDDFDSNTLSLVMGILGY